MNSEFLQISSFQDTGQWTQGAPETMCDDMTPWHGQEILVNDSDIVLDTESLLDNSPYVRVSIRSSSRPFIGFMIKAIDVDLKVTGEWSVPYLQYHYYPESEPTVQFLNCDQQSQSAVTHTQSFTKSQEYYSGAFSLSFFFSANVISLQWNPSKKFSVNVVFVATLVGDYSTFWKLSSDRLDVFSSEMQNRKTYDFVNPRNQTILKTSLKIMSDWNNSNLKFLSSSSSSLVFPVSLLGGILILMFCFESPNFKSF